MTKTITVTTTETPREEALARAIAQAVAKAEAYYLRSFGGSEVWEVSADQVTIRAWTEDGDDYGLWTASIES